eukprot:gene15253-21335_t
MSGGSRSTSMPRGRRKEVEKDKIEKSVAQAEAQVAAARKQKKMTDGDLQTMMMNRISFLQGEQSKTLMNRISFLQGEESKIDRDIENMRNKTKDLLNRKVEKAEKLNDEDTAVTVKEILGALPPSVPRVARSSSGRSTLAAAASSSQPVSPGLKPKASTPGTSGLPPRQRSASAQRPAPSPASKTSSEANPNPKLKRNSSAESSRSTSRSGKESSVPKPPRASLSSSGGSNSMKGVRSSMSLGRSGDKLGETLPAQGPPTPSGSKTNKMELIGGAAGSELDQDIVEELIGGGNTCDQPTKLEGLHQFSTQTQGKVVLRAAATKTQSSVAAGVGWGLGRGSYGPEATGVAMAADKKEASQAQKDFAKKQQLWKVRKTFGLDPTPLKDASAKGRELICRKSGIRQVAATVWGSLRSGSLRSCPMPADASRCPRARGPSRGASGAE